MISPLSLFMQIQRIEIIGFKSFVDKTVLNFEDGITAILGPNGCGKSNIIDAIRWGMGEQNAKNLRGQAMEDVIFGGSEKRRAHGMAEVTMVFANQGDAPKSALNEYTEVMVTRRLYRNGDSEYLMNKTPCRLKDIAELFMDTGVGARAYSIIEQGKIGTILHARPEERRVLIEEVAGVTKYKVRKKAALRKIEQTRQNLTRLNDIISEVEGQLNGLRRQANKAQRFRDLRQQVKELDLLLSCLKWRALDEQAVRLDADFSQLNATVAASDAKVRQMELALEKQRLALVEAEDAASNLQAQLYQREAELQRFESKIEMGMQQASHLTSQRDELNVELEQMQKRDIRRTTELKKLQSTQSNIDQQCHQLEYEKGIVQECVTHQSDQEQKFRGDLDQLRRTLLNQQGELLRKQGEHDQAQQRLSFISERRERYCAEQRTVVERQQEAQDAQQHCEQQLAQLRELFVDGKEELLELQHQHRDHQLVLQTLCDELQTCRNAAARCTSHIDSLQDLSVARSGCRSGTKEILEHSGLAHLFYNTLADGIQVAVGYDKAVAAALGDQLQSLPLDCIATLQSVDDAISSELTCLFQLAHEQKVVQFSHAEALVDKVTSSEAVAPFLSTLLQGCYCVDDLLPFMEKKLPVGVTLVTLLGESLDWRGRLIRGEGTTESHQVLKNRRHLEELREQRNAHDEMLLRLVADEKTLVASRDKQQSELKELDLELHRYQVKIEEQGREQKRCKQELERWTERRELLAFDLEQGSDEESLLLKQKQRTMDAVNELTEKNSIDEAQVENLAKQWQECVDTLKLEQQRLTQLQVQHAEVKERARSLEHEAERERGAARGQHHRRKQIDERLASLAKQELELVSTRQEYEQRLQVLMTYRQRERDQLVKMKNDVESVVAKVEGDGELVKMARQEAQSQHEQLNTVKMALQQCQLDLEHLCQSVMDKYHIDFRDNNEHFDQIDLEKPPANSEDMLTRLRERLDAFGEVNLMAIEEFNALEERYAFLLAQRTDLQQSVDDLHSAISQINRTTRRRFKEAFEQVNLKFKEVFPRLFVGGEASLALTDEGDLLESGIEIIAQPPGKKLQNVGLLSGGEKALTAVALIFAIFLIKPSPFCILDEVDAPLDDANIGRFNEMVQEMACASQFMIVTHNTRTMKIADTLFGVTMEDPGVSNLVAVRVGDFVSEPL